MKNIQSGTCLKVTIDKDGVFEHAVNLYTSELERVIGKIYPNIKPGLIRWEKWDKEAFDKRMLKLLSKDWKTNVDIQEIYTKAIDEYTRIYIQQDFMEELYGYTYSCGKGVFKDYGNAVFYAMPYSDGKYDVQEFLSYWVCSIVVPKYAKWKKHDKIGKIRLSQRWRPLYDIIQYYDKEISKENAKIMLKKALTDQNILLKEITDYEIIF